MMYERKGSTRTGGESAGLMGCSTQLVLTSAEVISIHPQSVPLVTLLSNFLSCLCRLTALARLLPNRLLAEKW